MTKRATAANVAATTERSDACVLLLTITELFTNALGGSSHRMTGPIRQQSKRDEGEEPWDVEPGPVREHELEADQERARQRRQLQRCLGARHERHGDGPDHEQPFEHALHEVEIG